MFPQISKKFGLVSKSLPPGAAGPSSGTSDTSAGAAYVFNGVYQPLACKIVQVDIFGDILPTRTIVYHFTKRNFTN
jgi:hypothetical protein